MEEYDGRDFVGVKAALFYNGKLFVYQRDDKPGLRFAGLWDFFGGGREGEETPFACLARELNEELELRLKPWQVVFSKVFPAMHDPTKEAYFMVAHLNEADIARMHFGSEGQVCGFVTVEEFMEGPGFVPDLKPRLQSYLEKSKESSENLLQKPHR